MREEELQSLVANRLPPELATQPPIIRHYPDELVIVLQLEPGAAGEEPTGVQQFIARRREETRALRMKLARELERATGLAVAWGMRVGEVEALFTSRTAPVMSRLGRMEREVLDTLVAAGVADTRSSALAYTVRAFAAEHAEWLGEVRHAIAEVERVRGRLHVRPRKGMPRAPKPSNDEQEAL